MSKFHSLTVASVTRETRDAVVLTLAVPPALQQTFRFTQGQHLTFRTTIDGEDVRRSYSICSAVHDGVLRVAVKKSAGGRFSTWVNESVAAGHALDVMPPLGHFNVALDADNRKNYVAFAAGSGITPILSIIKTTLLIETRSAFTLFYGNRSSSAVMFREELADLKSRFMSRFNLVYVMSREVQDIELLNGRIDRGKADALLRHWTDPASIDAAFVCGPEGMMRAVEESLLAAGVAQGRIRIERFASSIPKPEARPRPALETGHGECRVAVVIDGARREYTVRKNEENILDAALRQGIELPYSCKGGVCSTCRARLMEGQVDMDVNFALEDYEVARGFILCCQSFAVTDTLEIDFDQSG